MDISTNKHLSEVIYDTFLAPEVVYAGLGPALEDQPHAFASKIIKWRSVKRRSAAWCRVRLLDRAFAASCRVGRKFKANKQNPVGPKGYATPGGTPRAHGRVVTAGPTVRPHKETDHIARLSSAIRTGSRSVVP